MVDFRKLQLRESILVDVQLQQLLCKIAKKWLIIYGLGGGRSNF